MAIPIRWLHLSDFHVGKDNYGQRRMFTYILDNIRHKREQGIVPDLVFITGDLGNRGQPNEYEKFNNEFVLPLAELLEDPDFERIYTIPGNHDVDRSRAKAASRYGVLDEVPEFFDPTEQGFAERRGLLERFAAFTRSDLTPRSGWLEKAQGAFTHSVSLHGYKLGILGINTAWFSRGDDDRHQLTPGKAIVESGLEAIKACDVRIVLGHHPLDWFIDDQIDAIRALFGRYNVMYLHGHLHKNRSRQEEGAGRPFLSLQAGACFQAREDELWVNRILWCELDLAAAALTVEPLRWSRDNQEWSMDGSAFPEIYRKPGSDRWVLPVPITSAVQPVVAGATAARLSFPAGWITIDKEFIELERRNLNSDQILGYFDGRIPTWAEALSPQIPRRAMVDEVKAALEMARQKKELGVILLTGAGGEGKSTVLRQVLCDLAMNDDSWQIIWHDDAEEPLPRSRIRSLPRTQGVWLIASDDADLIASDVFSTVKWFYETGRKNVQFLLCCRDTDWINAEADRLPWRSYVPTFVEKRMRGLSLEDAEKIVGAWNHYGDRGLRELSAVAATERAKKLVAEAKSEKYAQEGAFLGAMLRVRIGEGLKEHIMSLLLRLKQRPAPGGTLLDAFTYIAALHAENLLFLSKIVLAGVLRCKIGDIKPKVIGPLGEETAVAMAGQYILTRHRAIAEAAVELLSSKFHVDFEEIYVELLQTANQLYLDDEAVPDPGKWRYLSKHFFDSGRQDFGIRLARMLLKVDPEDPYLIVHLSKLYRETGQVEQSVELFRKAHKEVRSSDNRRSYFYEWGAAEGSLGNYCLDAWLSGVSLADGVARKAPNVRDGVLSLSGLSNVFRELCDNPALRNQVFIEACGAASQLAIKLDSIERQPQSGVMTRIKRNLEEVRAEGVPDVDLAVALERLSAGVRMAWDQREADLPEWVRKGNELTFHGLARLLQIE